MMKLFELLFTLCITLVAAYGCYTHVHFFVVQEQSALTTAPQLALERDAKHIALVHDTKCVAAMQLTWSPQGEPLSLSAKGELYLAAEKEGVVERTTLPFTWNITFKEDGALKTLHTTIVTTPEPFSLSLKSIDSDNIVLSLSDHGKERTRQLKLRSPLLSAHMINHSLALTSPFLEKTVSRLPVAIGRIFNNQSVALVELDEAQCR